MGIKIEDILIGYGKRPFVIAEMSGNHNQSLDRALEIVEAAAKSGAHALKLQTYTADSMTLNINDGEFFIGHESLWKGKNLYDLYKEAFTPWEWHKPIMKRANELGMICFSSPFDENAVDFLEELNVPAYKIASFENNYLQLIHKVASTGKPLIISTGMASIAELDEAVTTARDAGCKDIILLKCTSAYPASAENSNVLTIPHMKNLFGCEVGLSDHTAGIGVAVAAVALGATVIEKHFTLSRADGGVDSAFSLEPDELKSLVIETEIAWKSLGSVVYGVTDSEEKSKMFRRSLYIAEDMKAGEVFTEVNLRIVRPGAGLPPKYYEQFIGKKIKNSAYKGQPITWDLIG
ncbi:pseudaminic acid synthase [Candidatus Thioglobus sp.]|jgi:pseudaminic acid synthase|nr:pseudaminic acid synthase [Candidatus Thioglobus sp.]